MLVPTAPICHALCNCFTQVDKMDQRMGGEGGRGKESILRKDRGGVDRW